MRSGIKSLLCFAKKNPVPKSTRRNSGTASLDYCSSSRLENKSCFDDWTCRKRVTVPAVSVFVHRLTVFAKCESIFGRLKEYLGKKKKPTVPLLKNISFCAYPARLLGVIGSYGSGRTVLLKAIANKLNVNLIDSKSSIFGYFMENPTLTRKEYIMGCALFSYYEDTQELFFPNLTVLEAFRYTIALNLPSVSQRNRNRRVSYIIRKFELSKIQNITLQNLKAKYSIDEYKKVSIALFVLLNKNSIIIISKLNSDLDVSQTRKLIQILKRIAYEQSKTIIVSLDYPSYSTVELLDDIVVLHKGRLIFAGPPRELDIYFSAHMNRAIDDVLSTIIEGSNQMASQRRSSVDSSTMQASFADKQNNSENSTSIGTVNEYSIQHYFKQSEYGKLHEKYTFQNIPEREQWKLSSRLPSENGTECLKNCTKNLYVLLMRGLRNRYRCWTLYLLFFFVTVQCVFFAAIFLQKPLDLNNVKLTPWLISKPISNNIMFELLSNNLKINNDGDNGLEPLIETFTKAKPSQYSSIASFMETLNNFPFLDVVDPMSFDGNFNSDFDKIEYFLKLNIRDKVESDGSSSRKKRMLNNDDKISSLQKLNRYESPNVKSVWFMLFQILRSLRKNLLLDSRGYLPVDGNLKSLKNNNVQIMNSTESKPSAISFDFVISKYKDFCSVEGNNTCLVLEYSPDGNILWADLATNSESIPEFDNLSNDYIEDNSSTTSMPSNEDDGDNDGDNNGDNNPDNIADNNADDNDPSTDEPTNDSLVETINKEDDTIDNDSAEILLDLPEDQALIENSNSNSEDTIEGVNKPNDSSQNTNLFYSTNLNSTENNQVYINKKILENNNVANKDESYETFINHSDSDTISANSLDEDTATPSSNLSFSYPSITSTSLSPLQPSSPSLSQPPSSPPPSFQHPSSQPPSFQHPSSQPPSFQHPSSQPPSSQPPSSQPPSSQPPSSPDLIKKKEPDNQTLKQEPSYQNKNNIQSNQDQRENHHSPLQRNQLSEKKLYSQMLEKESNRQSNEKESFSQNRETKPSFKAHKFSFFSQVRKKPAQQNNQNFDSTYQFTFHDSALNKSHGATVKPEKYYVYQPSQIDLGYLPILGNYDFVEHHADMNPVNIKDYEPLQNSSKNQEFESTQHSEIINKSQEIYSESEKEDQPNWDNEDFNSKSGNHNMNNKTASEITTDFPVKLAVVENASDISSEVLDSKVVKPTLTTHQSTIMNTSDNSNLSSTNSDENISVEINVTNKKEVEAKLDKSKPSHKAVTAESENMPAKNEELQKKNEYNYTQVSTIKSLEKSSNSAISIFENTIQDNSAAVLIPKLTPKPTMKWEPNSTANSASNPMTEFTLKLNLESGSKLSIKSEPNTSTKSTPKPSTESTPKTSSKSAPKTTTKSAPKTTTKSAPKTTTKSAPKTTTKLTPKTTTKLTPKTTTKLTPKTTTKLTPKTTTKSTPKTTTKSTPKTTTKSTPKPTTKSTSKPATKSPHKPTTKSTSKPTTNQTPKPKTKKPSTNSALNMKPAAPQVSKNKEQTVSKKENPKKSPNNKDLVNFDFDAPGSSRNVDSLFSVGSNIQSQEIDRSFRDVQQGTSNSHQVSNLNLRKRNRGSDDDEDEFEDDEDEDYEDDDDDDDDDDFDEDEENLIQFVSGHLDGFIKYSSIEKKSRKARFYQEKVQDESNKMTEDAETQIQQNYPSINRRRPAVSNNLFLKLLTINQLMDFFWVRVNWGKLDMSHLFFFFCTVSNATSIKINFLNCDDIQYPNFPHKTLFSQSLTYFPLYSTDVINTKNRREFVQNFLDLFTMKYSSSPLWKTMNDVCGQELYQIGSKEFYNLIESSDYGNKSDIIHKIFSLIFILNKWTFKLPENYEAYFSMFPTDLVSTFDLNLTQSSLFKSNIARSRHSDVTRFKKQYVENSTVPNVSKTNIKITTNSSVARNSDILNNKFFDIFDKLDNIPISSETLTSNFYDMNVPEKKPQNDKIGTSPLYTKSYLDVSCTGVLCKLLRQFMSHLMGIADETFHTFIPFILYSHYHTINFYNVFMVGMISLSFFSITHIRWLSSEFSQLKIEATHHSRLYILMSFLASNLLDAPMQIACTTVVCLTWGFCTHYISSISEALQLFLICNLIYNTLSSILYIIAAITQNFVAITVIYSVVILLDCMISFAGTMEDYPNKWLSNLVFQDGLYLFTFIKFYDVKSITLFPKEFKLFSVDYQDIGVYKSYVFALILKSLTFHLIALIILYIRFSITEKYKISHF